jgi:NTP pyrophosphatase (non-canonical NTP hydrolase)
MVFSNAFDEYCQATGITLKDLDKDLELVPASIQGPERQALVEKLELVMLGLGAAGEAGEVADLVKKHVFHGHPLDREKLIKEIGDTLWALARLSAKTGISFGAVARANLAKLAKRYPQGFSNEASINRKE